MPSLRTWQRAGYTRRLTAHGGKRTPAPVFPLLYRLKDRERWTLVDRDRVMVVHPDRSAKVVYPDGRVEEIASKLAMG